MNLNEAKFRFRAHSRQGYQVVSHPELGDIGLVRKTTTHPTQWVAYAMNGDRLSSPRSQRHYAALACLARRPAVADPMVVWVNRVLSC